MKQAAREQAAQPTEPAKSSNRRTQKPMDPRDPVRNPPWPATLGEGEEFDPRNPLHNPPDLSGILLQRDEPVPQAMKPVVKTAASSRPIRKPAGAPLPVPQIVVTSPGETTPMTPPFVQKKAKRPPTPKPTIAPTPVANDTANPNSVAALDALLSVPASNRGKRGGARPGAGRKPKSRASQAASPEGSTAPGAVAASVTAGQTVVPTTAAPISGHTNKPQTRIVVKNAPSQLSHQPVSNAGPSGNIQPQQPPSLAPVGYAPTNPNPSAPPAVPTARDNPNTHRYPGKFLTKVLYVKPDAKVMAGHPWTEQEDLLFWYLKDKGMTYAQIGPHLFPHPASGCQNRWRLVKDIIFKMDEQEKEVAEKEKARLGQLFESGDFGRHVALAAEAAEAAEAKRLNPEVKKEGSGKTNGKGKRKAEKMSQGDEGDEESGGEGEKEAKVAKKE